MDELKVQIFARDQTISKLERELKKKTEQYHSALHEMSHTGEIVHSVRSKDNSIFFIISCIRCFIIFINGNIQDISQCMVYGIYRYSQFLLSVVL